MPVGMEQVLLPCRCLQVRGKFQDNVGRSTVSSSVCKAAFELETVSLCPVSDEQCHDGSSSYIR